jgi:hypothetical protein
MCFQVAVQDVLSEWVDILLPVLTVPVSYVGQETSFRADGFSNFAQSLQANAVIMLQIRPRPPPCTSFPVCLYYNISGRCCKI